MPAMRRTRKQNESLEGPTDAELVERVLAGEGRAFGDLYRRHGEKVARFVRFRVRNRESAEDLTQEIFVRALRGLSDLKNRERFGPWLMRIAHNLVCNFYRNTANRPSTTSLDADPDEGEPVVVVATDDPGPDIETRITAAQLLDRAGGLPESQQEVLSLRFVAGLSLKETADLMGRSENAVKQLQYRAMVELRDRVLAEASREPAGRAAEPSRGSAESTQGQVLGPPPGEPT